MSQTLRPISVTAINMALDYCNPVANGCSVLNQNAASLTFSYATSGDNNILTMTDPLGRVTRYTTDINGFLVGIKRPGAAQDSTLISYDTNGRVATFTRDGQTWAYSYADEGNIRTTTTTHAATGKTRIVTGDIALSVVLSSTDELGRKTSYTYDTMGRLMSVTTPEQTQTLYTYDARGNITTTTVKAKPGSGLADIVTTAGYSTTCTSGPACNSPLWTKDALGKQTDYSYDASTGLLLTLTTPAPSSGAARPQQRYSYTSLQAYYKNSAGAIVASGEPIVKLVGTSTCITGSSCAGTAQEAVTSISYGSQQAGVANNLLPVSTTQGNGNASLSVSEHYTYDIAGNVVGVDGPVPGTADTVIRRYDAARQLIGVISPDPDGAGPRKRSAVRAFYNADGQVTDNERGTVAGLSDADWAAFTLLEKSKTHYDATGKPILSQVIAAGSTYAVAQYAYDARDRLLCVAQRLNPAVFASLPSNACVQGTPGSAGPDRITQYSYDDANQTKTITEGVGVSGVPGLPRVAQTLDYGLNGQQTAFSDAKGNKTVYTYDGFIRPKQVIYPSKTTAGQVEGSDYTDTNYDAFGRVVSARLRDGQLITHSYDDLGRLTLRDVPDADRDESVAYDNLGRVTSVSLPGANASGSVGTSYDVLGRITATTTVGRTVRYEYDPGFLWSRLIYPDGMSIQYDRNIIGEVVRIREVNASGATLRLLASYAYDDLGRRTSVTYELRCQFTKYTNYAKGTQWPAFQTGSTLKP